MPTTIESIEQHYQQSLSPAHLLQEVTRLLGSELDPAQLAPIDQLHLGGRRASLALLNGIELKTGSRVLDVGCGLGGTSRLIAEQVGCEVFGVDITADFCQLAAQLSRRLRMPLPTYFVQGDAQQLPFPAQSIDLVVSQHCLMNLPDPVAALNGFKRLLRSEGRIVLHELLAGPGGAPYFPTPWASTAEQSHLCDENSLRAWCKAAGLQLHHWEDQSEAALSWRSRHTKREAAGAPALSPKLIYGDRFPTLAANLQRSLEEQRVRVIHAILR